MIRGLAFGLSLLAGPLAAQEIVVIGDSIMEWNAEDGAAIADAMGAALGVRVDNRAVSGAQFSHAGWLGRLSGLDIRGQLGRDQPDIVIMNGGANDLGEDCGCAVCDPTLDGLITVGLDGEMPLFLSALAGAGTQVIYLGYYEVRPETEFHGCEAAFDRLHDRLAAFAEATEGVTFATARAVVTPDEPELYDVDGIHPSPEGSARIGAHLAAILNEAVRN